MVTYLKVSLSLGNASIITGFALMIHFMGADSDPAIIVLLYMLLGGLTSVRASAALFSKYAILDAPVPFRSWFFSDLSRSEKIKERWDLLVAVLFAIWVLRDYEQPLIWSAVIVGCGSLGRLWSLRAHVTAVSEKLAGDDELKAHRSIRARARREANLFLSQGLTTASNILGIATSIMAILALIPPTSHLWRWALLLAFLYIILGSSLRAAAEIPHPMWISIDVIRLWKVSKKTMLLSAAAAGIGAATGALIGCAVWLATSQHSLDGEVFDMIGRWVTAGTALGAVLGVLALPKFAFVRHRELHRLAQDQQTPLDQ
ncbi:hypothetical protein [Streptomyces sp. R08]|uniref:Integral membrane protein n=1 Tax=Streptomyces sp. R08 TaxID=3238624 RepID=A0AB39M0W4_9ACTN